MLDPQLILEDDKYVDATAKALEKVFEISNSAFNKILKEKSDVRYYVMKDYKGLKKEKVKAFKALAKKDKNIKGVTFDERYKRYCFRLSVH